MADGLLAREISLETSARAGSRASSSLPVAPRAIGATTSAMKRWNFPSQACQSIRAVASVEDRSRSADAIRPAPRAHLGQRVDLRQLGTPLCESCASMAATSAAASKRRTRGVATSAANFASPAAAEPAGRFAPPRPSRQCASPLFAFFDGRSGAWRVEDGERNGEIDEAGRRQRSGISGPRRFFARAAPSRWQRGDALRRGAGRRLREAKRDLAHASSPVVGAVARKTCCPRGAARARRIAPGPRELRRDHGRREIRRHDGPRRSQDRLESAQEAAAPPRWRRRRRRRRACHRAAAARAARDGEHGGAAGVVERRLAAPARRARPDGGERGGRRDASSAPA